MSQRNILATLDIGTNTVLLLIAECHPNGKIVPLSEFVATSRLGENSSETGLLDQEAIERTIKAAEEMQQIAEKEGASHLMITTTSAVRNAVNRSAFLVKCHKRLKIYPQLLSGKEEAKLAFLGATNNLENNIPVVLFDVGGGSIEIAYGTRNNMVEAHSFEIGCSRLAEIFDLKNKITLRRQMATQNHIRKHLNPIKSKIGQWASQNNPQVVISGGTATNYAAVIKKQLVYDRNAIQGTQSNIAELNQTLKKIGKMSTKERLKIPGLEKERVEIFPAGLLLILTSLSIFSFDSFSVTTDGLRMGTLRYYLNSKSV